MMDLKILIVVEHASARFGGEAVLPIHYFRELRARGLPVWLLTHARTREELAQLFPAEDRIVYIEDTRFHIAMFRVGRHLPDRVGYLTTGFLSRVSTQIAQRRVARRLVREHDIDVIHQPIPVSPREPSLLFGLGAPVIIGPMNGGMEYPPAFRQRRGIFEQALVWFGRASARILNVLMPGKRRAAMLLVANGRTRAALAVPTQGRVAELVENGVDLSLWTPLDRRDRDERRRHLRVHGTPSPLEERRAVAEGFRRRAESARRCGSGFSATVTSGFAWSSWRASCPCPKT